MSTAVRLEARGLVKRYGGRPVVDGISLEVGAGEVVGLLGPNGAGKTTTFYLIVGLVRPDGGAIVLGDRDITRMPVYRRSRMGLAYLAQEPSVFRRMTVEQNLDAVLQLRRMPAGERRQVARRLLEQFGLVSLAKSRAASLSGGERRRAEVARALALEPRFLLLDEPFTGVDPIAVADLQRIIRTLVEQGIGVLITDHNVRETLAITDRAYIIHQGRILASGPSESIARDAAARRYYFGDDFQL
ncbi:LPS export ABC transporter ATP-binding protein [Carboxydochorda subterranea]|uniref:LPS export ABC transporter ATP-binding protein n=1 Tax=Carboxydichorda subterranea TaxID=3109565 RepID=A0ABZ1BW43_9FIRM|nr:LPS export ABC transporter ATP-binding protein [Limnochorda sp. L945t]WRP16896.1 LPS export ABC transporter ATP-binding protein [Limnochorda sp. L945t]